MNAALCCSPLPYSVAVSQPVEAEAHEAMTNRLLRGAQAVVQLMDAFARQLSSQRTDALRMAEFIAREHSLARW